MGMPLPVPLVALHDLVIILEFSAVLVAKAGYKASRLEVKDQLVGRTLPKTEEGTGHKATLVAPPRPPHQHALVLAAVLDKVGIPVMPLRAVPSVGFRLGYQWHLLAEPQGVLEDLAEPQGVMG